MIKVITIEVLCKEKVLNKIAGLQNYSKSRNELGQTSVACNKNPAKKANSDTNG